MPAKPETGVYFSPEQNSTPIISHELLPKFPVIEGVITAVDGRLAFGRSFIFQTDWNRAVDIGPCGEGLSQRPAPLRATGRRQAGERGI